MRYRTRIELMGQGHMDFAGLHQPSKSEGRKAVEVEPLRLEVVELFPSKPVVMLDTAALVQAVRLHAQANYNRSGWDFVVEAWDDSDIAESIQGARTVAGAISKVRLIVAALSGHRAEVQAS